MSGPSAEGGPLPPVDRELIEQHERRIAEWQAGGRVTDLPPWPGPITAGSPYSEVEARLDHHLAERRARRTPLPRTGGGTAGDEEHEDGQRRDHLA